VSVPSIFFLFCGGSEYFLKLSESAAARRVDCENCFWEVLLNGRWMQNVRACLDIGVTAMWLFNGLSETVAKCLMFGVLPHRQDKM
jgi:hypothetical protein